MRTVYQASDDRIFYDRKECERYEQKIKVANSPALISLVKDIFKNLTVASDYNGEIIEFSNNEEYAAVVLAIAKNLDLINDAFSGIVEREPRRVFKPKKAVA